MEKLILEKRKQPDSKKGVIRIFADDYLYLDGLKRQTGLSLSELVSKFIAFGREHIELR